MVEPLQNKGLTYEDILHNCLVRVFERGELPQEVLVDYPGWAASLVADIEIAQQVRSLQKYSNPRNGFLVQSRSVVLDQVEQAVKDRISARSFHRIRDCFASFAIRVVTIQNYLRVPKPQRHFFQKVIVVAVIILFVVLSTGALRWGTCDALPGSVSFPIRVTFESAQLLFIMNNEKEAKTHLDFAQAYLVDYAILASQGRWQDADFAFRQYDRHIVHASRILHDLLESDHQGVSTLYSLFTRTYLQDLELFQVLSQGTT